MKLDKLTLMVALVFVMAVNVVAFGDVGPAQTLSEVGGGVICPKVKAKEELDKSRRIADQRAELGLSKDHEIKNSSGAL